MAMKQTRGPRQDVRLKAAFEGDLLKSHEVRVNLVYMRGGVQAAESVVVPKSLIHAMTDPGESGMGPMEAMERLREFYTANLGPELVSLSDSGGVSVPAAILNSQLQHSYSVHAVIAATDGRVSGSLMLQNPKVKKRLRTIAATLTGIPLEDVKELDLRETTMFVDRTVTVTTRKPTLSFKTQRIVCDMGSHTEERELTLPAETSVAEARGEQEQRIRRLPQVQGELQAAFEEIEALRSK